MDRVKVREEGRGMGRRTNDPDEGVVCKRDVVLFYGIGGACAGNHFDRCEVW